MRRVLALCKMYFQESMANALSATNVLTALGTPGDADQLSYTRFRRGARSGAVLPQVIRQHIASASSSLAWAQHQELPTHKLPEWSVARWVASEALRCETGASRALSSLRWIESAFGFSYVCLHAQHLYRDKVHHKSASAWRPIHQQKHKCPDEGHVCLWETLVVEHPSPVVRIYAGAT